MDVWEEFLEDVKILQHDLDERDIGIFTIVNKTYTDRPSANLQKEPKGSQLTLDTSLVKPIRVLEVNKVGLVGQKLLHYQIFSELLPGKRQHRDHLEGM